VRAEVKGLHVGLAEVRFTAYFDLTHLKFLLYGGSGHTEVWLVKVFNIDHDELTQTLTACQSFEGVLPVIDSVDFVSSHGVDVDNMNGRGHFINQHDWADTSKLFTKLRR